MTGVPYISVNRLYKRYRVPNEDWHEVLRGVSLQLFPNELLIILGKSGTGKSVLLRHIAGLEKADSGEICYADSLLNQGRLKNWAISMVFQGGALFDFLSVKENIAFGLKAYNEQTKRYSSKEIDDKVQQALKDIDLVDVADFNPNQLSGGMIKRVALARSLVYSPQVVLYDEPTAGLDPMTSQDITRLIAHMCKKQGVAGIIVTHDLALALALGDRIAIHSEGVFKRIYTKEEFVQTEDRLAKQFLNHSN